MASADQDVTFAPSASLLTLSTMTPKFKSLALLAICEVAALSLWFSASAVIPSLRLEFPLTADQASLITNAVQAGFVVGTIISAVLGLADRLDPRRFFMAATLIAAIANASILLLDPTSFGMLVCRFITGACMAGVYPVGMKLATTWAERDMGLLVGALVGAVTLGSHVPHLINAFGGLDWRFTIGTASAISLLAALLINLTTIGPNAKPSPPFDPHAAFSSFKSPALRLANFGYLGHMWELYAMWAWLGVFLDASFSLTLGAVDGAFWARLATFATIGVGGALGCLFGGLFADRLGRTTLTIGAMAISGTCALFTGLLFGANPVLLFAVCMVWGITIVADSAQFSASIAELAPPDRIGTMLTVQTCAGFLLTLATIQIMPYAVDWLGWRFAFALLAIGPFFGVLSMARLRRHPDSIKLAHGRR